MADRSGLVIVQPGSPVEVDYGDDMSSAAWVDYHHAVWHARLAAQVHARYFSRWRLLLGVLTSGLQSIVFLGSAGAFISLLAQLDPAIPTYVSLAVTVAAGVLAGLGLSARVQKAATLAEAWSVRCAFWDDAWILVQDSRYLGPLGALRQPEADLTRAEAELGVPEIQWYVKLLQDQVEKADPLARRQRV